MSSFNFSFLFSIGKFYFSRIDNFKLEPNISAKLNVFLMLHSERVSIHSTMLSNPQHSWAQSHTNEYNHIHIKLHNPSMDTYYAISKHIHIRNPTLSHSQFINSTLMILSFHRFNVSSLRSCSQIQSISSPLPLPFYTITFYSMLDGKAASAS